MNFYLIDLGFIIELECIGTQRCFEGRHSTIIVVICVVNEEGVWDESSGCRLLGLIGLSIRCRIVDDISFCFKQPYPELVFCWDQWAENIPDDDRDIFRRGIEVFKRSVSKLKFLWSNLLVTLSRIMSLNSFISKT